MEGPIFSYLYQCTVRLILPDSIGTGFFVTPNKILTCAHVVGRYQNALERIEVYDRNKKYDVESIKVLSDPYPDLALLLVKSDDHACVYLDSQVGAGHKLYAYGYMREYPGGAWVSVEYEGPQRLDYERWLLRFKGGQIIPGYSGSPLLNTQTWSVCGVVKSTRDRVTDLGGGGIPAEVVLTNLPELGNLQKEAPVWVNRWIEAVRQQRESQESGPGLPIITITAQTAQIRVATSTIDIEQDKLAPQTILTKLWSPLSIDWYREDRLALGSRDGVLRIVGTNGHMQREIQVPAYPSYVAVHNQTQVAAVCYTKLYVANLTTNEARSVEVDPHASCYCVAWSTKGEYIAVGATNTLQIFTPDLKLVSQHPLGGKYGAKALAWSSNGTTLYVGIGNGEFWRLAEPFDSPTVLFKGNSFLIGIRSSTVDDRLACLWKDGTLEIRQEEGGLASTIVHSSNTWRANGPKLAWCLTQNALACTTGVSNELILWRFDTGLGPVCKS